MNVFFTNVEALASKFAFEILKNEEKIQNIKHRGPISEEELCKIVGEFDAIVVDGRAHITANVINSARRLKILARTGIGLNNIDIKTATERGIYVTYTPGANARAVAEHAIGMMLALSRKFLIADRETRKGNYWFRNQNYGIELLNKTIGIIGLGAIGKHLARIAHHGFEMKVLAFDPYITDQIAMQHNAELVELSQVLAESDFISVNCPLTKETHGLIGGKELQSMKKTAYLINTARSGVVNEKALYNALSNGHIAGAGLDVLEQEPDIDPENPLFKLENVVLSPHCGGLTLEALQRVGEEVADSVKKILHNEIPRAENVVNKELLA